MEQYQGPKVMPRAFDNLGGPVAVLRKVMDMYVDCKACLELLESREGEPEAIVIDGLVTGLYTPSSLSEMQDLLPVIEDEAREWIRHTENDGFVEDITVICSLVAERSIDLVCLARYPRNCPKVHVGDVIVYKYALKSQLLLLDTLRELVSDYIEYDDDEEEADA